MGTDVSRRGLTGKLILNKTRMMVLIDLK